MDAMYEWQANNIHIQRVLHYTSKLTPKSQRVGLKHLETSGLDSSRAELRTKQQVCECPLKGAPARAKESWELGYL